MYEMMKTMITVFALVTSIILAVFFSTNSPKDIKASDIFTSF